jgi:general L-amino acid transport system permease protein
MSESTFNEPPPSAEINVRPMMAPPREPSRILKLLKRMFGSWYDILITIACLSLLVWLVPKVANWGVINAVWFAEDSDKCGPAAGACWAVIDARWRLILFGLYPFEQHWRSGLACAIVVFVAVLSCVPAFWRPFRLAALWIIGFTAFYTLMYGGVLGLSEVTTERWGGLALTIFIFASVALLGMPMAIIFALTRQSELPVLRWMAGLLIDTVRSFPLLAILFTAAVILPFVLPEWLKGDKLYRVIFAFAVFFGAYQAEVIRGGLQSIPDGQADAAKALGLGYWRRTWLITLPQAFRNTLPATINQFVITFKETSIVIIIGFFEVLASGNAAYGSGKWTETYVEVYVFIAGIYFIFVFSLSRYGAYLEKRMRVGHD